MTLVMQHRFEPVQQYSASRTKPQHPRLVIENLSDALGPGVALASICTIAEPPAPKTPAPRAPGSEPAENRRPEVRGWLTA
ncbi:hypothetical protein [Streptomyces longisporoflavus]|uniref:hypothetical protein n=1 Tax=Streptomyces longisporoflavus TaxID=28044 RepID=UPI00167C9FC2|nr:hypothetical protein [Streptomyces longisporoflavus]